MSEDDADYERLSAPADVSRGVLDARLAGLDPSLLAAAVAGGLRALSGSVTSSIEWGDEED